MTADAAGPPGELARAAARRGIDVLVHVPAPPAPGRPTARAPRRVLDGPAADDAQSAGLAWFLSPRPRPNRAGPCGEGSVLVALRDATGVALGVVVASAAGAAHWSDVERDEIRTMILRHAGELEPALRQAPPPAESALDFATDLRAALGTDELRVAYQPEVDLRTGETVGVEALVRWRHPRLGELGPEWFIGLAERSDLIVLVGNWVLEHALADLARWNAAFPGLDLVLRVNVSPVQLVAADIVAPVTAALERHRVPGRQLCLELTEHAPLGDPAEVAGALARLRALGVTSAVDDLATGYSALTHLRTLSVEWVKVDRALVGGIDTDRRAQTIMVALIGLALSLGVGLVAEGVETAGEARTLFALGCTRAQGHHLGRPVPAADITARLAEQRRTPRNADISHGL